MNDHEIVSPPEDSVSCLKFSPAGMQGNFLIAGSWANDVRCWQLDGNGSSAKAQQKAQGPILDVCWGEDYKVFMASADKTALLWDLGSNQTMQVAAHDGPIKTCHWIKGSNYSCLMTGSWDKTVKFWDTRQPKPMKTLQMPERVYCADVKYPMGMVSCADRKLVCLKLDHEPSEFQKIESPLKYQHRCISIFKDKSQSNPVGFALGSIEGRVAINYIQPTNPRDNFTFKCHRSVSTSPPQDIYAVNGIAFHPTIGTLATVGSDGKFSFWDKDARTKLKGSEQLDQPLSACAINPAGTCFAYAASYDWSKGHEHHNISKKPKIFIRNFGDEMKPRKTNR